MPLYDYECKKCGDRFEVVQSIHDEALKACEKNECDGELLKVIGAPKVELKGSCWARDGYK